MKFNSFFPKVGFGLILTATFLSPIFFLTLTPEFYDFNKQALLITLSLLSLLALAATWVTDRQVRLTRSTLDLPLILFFAVFLASTILKAPNRLDTLINPGQTGTYLALTLFFFCLHNFIRTKKELEILVSAFIFSCLTLASVTLLSARS